MGDFKNGSANSRRRFSYKVVLSAFLTHIICLPVEFHFPYGQPHAYLNLVASTTLNNASTKKFKSFLQFLKFSFISFPAIQHFGSGSTYHDIYNTITPVCMNAPFPYRVVMCRSIRPASISLCVQHFTGSGH